MIEVKTQLTQRDIEAYFEAERNLRTERYGLTAETLTAALMAFHRAAVESRVGGDKYTTLAAEFTQTLRSIRQVKEVAGPLANGIYIRAALEAGIITGYDGDVGDMEPWRVVQLAEQVGKAVKTAYEIPKK